MSKSIVQWGILGTSEIAQKNWKAVRDSGNGHVAAVASRAHDRAKRFVDQCQMQAPFLTVPTPVEGYAELISRKDIDAVYVPLPTAIRKQWLISAADNGKHVLCETPCAMTAADLIDILDACQGNGVQFMDGTMFMHSRRLQIASNVLNDGKTVGTTRRISSVFNFSASADFIADDIRTDCCVEPYGCLGNLGWYCIRIALWAMNWSVPARVAGRVLTWSPGSEPRRRVPLEFSGELFFAGGATSTFYCSFITEIQQWVNISGSVGYLRMPDFVIPFFGNETAFETRNPVLSIQGCDFNMESNTRRWTAKEYSNSHPSAQEAQMFRAMNEQILSGCLRQDWPAFSLATQRVMDACAESAKLEGQVVTVSQ